MVLALKQFFLAVVIAIAMSVVEANVPAAGKRPPIVLRVRASDVAWQSLSVTVRKRKRIRSLRVPSVLSPTS